MVLIYALVHLINRTKEVAYLPIYVYPPYDIYKIM